MSTHDRPNILWISFEDTSPRFGCHGDPAAITPVMDRLAAEGVLYHRAYSTAPVSAPARAAVITGMYATFMGCHQMRTGHGVPRPPARPYPYAAVPPHYVRCFTEYLRADGYFCTNNCKTDYQFDSFQNVPFTAWDVQGQHRWGKPYDISAAHWRQRPAGTPFFSVFNLDMSHESSMWNGLGEAPRVTDRARLTVPPYLNDTPETREALGRHYDQLAANDRIAGQILQQLEEDGLAEQTIVFIWADHGNGLPRGKRWPYDSGIHVPLLVRFPKSWQGRPGIPAPGQICSDLVSTIDLGPTVLSLCGVPIPAHLQGRAFLGAARRTPRTEVFATRDRMDEAYIPVRAVRDQRYKYIRNLTPIQSAHEFGPYSFQNDAMQDLFRLELDGPPESERRYYFNKRQPEELYDTLADPWEMHNLVDEPGCRDDLERLRARLDEWIRDYDPYANVDEAEMVRRWHPNGEQSKTAEPQIFPIVHPDFYPLRPSGQPFQAFSNEGTTMITDAATFRGPVLLTLHCPTQGAALGYAIEEGAATRWRLYTGPIRVEAGRTVSLRAKAVRYGFATSPEVAVTITTVAV